MSFQGFLRSLKSHLLRRLPGSEADGGNTLPTDADIQSVRIAADKLYVHKTMRINYTTYDMRRGQDSVNPRTHADVMMYASDTSSPHQYLYTRIIGIFHVNVYRTGADICGADDTEPIKLSVLWVRWFDLDARAPGGFKRCRLHRLKWAATDDEPYGFIDPEDVLRASHLIPAFAFGTIDEPARDDKDENSDSDEDPDWKYHYVNMSVSPSISSRAR